MQRFLRFVNRFSNLFLLRQRRALHVANLTGRPRNPCQCCFAAPRCVARGRILRDEWRAGKWFSEIIRESNKSAAISTTVATVTAGMRGLP